LTLIRRAPGIGREMETYPLPVPARRGDRLSRDLAALSKLFARGVDVGQDGRYRFALTDGRDGMAIRKPGRFTVITVISVTFFDFQGVTSDGSDDAVFNGAVIVTTYPSGGLAQ
jgi:hypothetical protein